jgi:membrane protein implicated in regulation of membrane protease activity
MLFFALLAVLMGSFLVVFLIASLSPTSLFLTLIVVVIVWVVVRSYRKWVAGKTDEERDGKSVSVGEQS